MIAGDDCRRFDEGSSGNQTGLPAPQSTMKLPSLFAAAPLCVGLALSATAEDMVPLNPAAPNYTSVFPRGVRTGDTVPQPETGKAGEEILLAVYAWLSPDSPVKGEAAYLDRLLVLLDHRFGLWGAGQQLRDIGSIWQAHYAYHLLKRKAPETLTPERVALYEDAILVNQTSILSDNPLLYQQGILAQGWLNGDIRLAMALYFGALARGDSATAETARKALDDVLCLNSLADGATRYVGFWGEVSTYHDESIRCLLWWWKITGSPAAKASVDATLRYAVVANEPDGFTEQSSNIPYKHMYNNIRSTRSSLWKAYLYNDGYNYFFGKPEETTTSTELLNTILYQPDRFTRTPPTDVGVFFDANIQGPRGRFGGVWGWTVNGRNVQLGGPENAALIAAQGYQGRQCGKATFVGAFALGTITNKTSLKGALDTVLVEFKESAGPETDLMRGSKYRYLAQDEQTRTITRRHFGTLSTAYRISRRTSAAASPNWSNGLTPWMGQQLWVLTGERALGLLQIVSDAPSTVFGLDARMVLTGGRHGIMGSYLDLTQPDTNSFAFGDLRARVPLQSFNGTVTSQRLAISEPNSADDFSALVRIHDTAIAGDDAPVTFPAGTRRWIVLDVHRAAAAPAAPVYNVLTNNTNWAVLQFHESARKVRIVQNLTGTARSYTGNFVVGTNHTRTTLHRSWTNTLTALAATNGTATVADTVPPYGHMIAVNSSQDDDHSPSHRTSAEVYGAAAYLNDLSTYATGSPTPAWFVMDPPALVFNRLRADVDYEVEVCSHIPHWRLLARNPGTVGGPVSVPDFPAPGEDPSRRFMRLRLSVPPPQPP